jgi:cobalt-zinc-cadmium efflux system outer membrane protein
MRNAFASVSTVLGVLAMYGIVAHAQDRPRTTSELVQTALERNRDLLAARQRVAETQGLLRQAGVRLNPTVELVAGTGRPLGTHGEQEYSASYFQPIETAGKRSKRVAVGQTGVTLAEAEVTERTRQLVFDVKTRIAEVTAAQAKNDALARLLTTSQESYRLTKARVAEGDAAALEEQLLVTEVARVEAQKATLGGRVASTLLDLRRVIGLSATDSLALALESPSDRELALDDLKARAVAARADLLAARATEQQAIAELTLARAEGVPDLTASAKYTHVTSEFENLYGLTALGAPSPLVRQDNVLTFGVSIPVFASGRNRGNVDAASARSTAARLRREYLEANIPQEVEAAYRRWTSARQTVALFRRGVIDQSEKNLGVMRQAYTLGQLRLLDVLNEQRRLIDTELAYVDAQTELAEAAAGLEQVIGTDLP